VSRAVIAGVVIPEDKTHGVAAGIHAVAGDSFGAWVLSEKQLKF